MVFYFPIRPLRRKEAIQVTDAIEVIKEKVDASNNVNEASKIIDSPLDPFMPNDIMKSLGIDIDSFRFYLLPIDQMMFTLRLENLEDHIDLRTPLD